MTLRRRLLLLVLAVLLPTAGLFAWIVVATYEREMQTARQHLRETARALALVVDRELDKRAAIGHTLAVTTGLMEGDHRRFYDEARLATEGTGNWVLLVDTDNQLVNTLVPFGTPLPPRLHDPLEPMAVDGPRVSDLRSDALTHKPALGVFVPVPNVTPPHFNVGVVFTPQAMQAILTQQRLPAGWIGAVLDAGFDVVARRPNPERLVGRRPNAEVVGAMQRDAEGFIDAISLDGVPVRAFFSRSPVYGWHFLIGVPQQQLTEAARRSAWTVGVAAALLGAFALSLALWSARRIRRPIEALERAARDLGMDHVPAFAPTGLSEADAVGTALQRAGVQASLLRLITDNLPVLISYVDRQGRYRLNNMAYERWFGRPRETFLGKTMREALGEAAWPVLGPHLDRALAGEMQRFELEIDYPAVGKRWVETHYIPHRSPGSEAGGEVDGVVVLVHDMSEQRQAHQELLRSEGALRESRNVLSLAMRGGRMGAWSRDLATEEVWWSRELAEICGFAQGSFGATTKGFRALVHPQDAANAAAAIEQAIATGEDYRSEFRIRHADGHWRWMEGRGRAVYDAQGRPTMLYGLGIDIDERKRAEEELQRLNAELANAARRKDEFLATLAHELRNPLAPITSALEVLRLKDPADRQLRWTRDVIDRQVRQLTRLVDDLLDVARITRGRIELRRERVDAAAIAQAAVEAARPVIEAAGHRLVLELPQQPLWLHADPTRLTQVLQNLLTNAAKYTPRGGTLRLAAHAEGAEAVLSVRDNGIGLAREHLQSVFEMFSQVTPALERSQGGLGIGLALVRGLVELHGGSVEAFSEGLGRGTEFVVRLPLAQVPAAESSAPGERASVAPLKVLVVDDNRDAAESLAMVLELNGHEVRLAHDGPSALEQAPSFQPELVLLDIGMPGMNGYEVAQRLRAMPGGAACTLAALTGWGQEEDKRRALQAGFDHHLTKPVDAQELDAVLAAVATRRGGAASPSS